MIIISLLGCGTPKHQLFMFTFYAWTQRSSKTFCIKLNPRKVFHVSPDMLLLQFWDSTLVKLKKKNKIAGMFVERAFFLRTVAFLLLRNAFYEYLN